MNWSSWQKYLKTEDFRSYGIVKIRKRTGTAIGSLFCAGNGDFTERVLYRDVLLLIPSGFVKMKLWKVETIKEEYYFRRCTGEGREVQL